MTERALARATNGDTTRHESARTRFALNVGVAAAIYLLLLATLQAQGTLGWNEGERLLPAANAVARWSDALRWPLRVGAGEERLLLRGLATLADATFWGLCCALLPFGLRWLFGHLRRAS